MVDDILHGTVRYFRREAVIALDARRSFRQNFAGDKGFYPQSMEKPGIHWPEGIDGKAAGDTHNEIPFPDQRGRVRRALPEKNVIALFDVIDHFRFIEDFFLADIGVFVTATAERVFVAVDIEHADRTEIVAGFALKFSFVNDIRGQNFIQIIACFDQKTFPGFLPGQNAHTETTH